MKLVMTLLARDEADIVDAQIAFHLHAGVDFVIATDNMSSDGTAEILEHHQRQGHLRLLREPGTDMRQDEWVTRMARLAAREHGADWVLNTDADEFWWPRAGSLKDVLAAVPERFGVVRGCWRHFVPRPDDGSFFAERMTARLLRPAHPGDKRTVFHAHQKVAHRADPDVFVELGNHNAEGANLEPLRGWHPIEVLHFSFRTVEQVARKAQGGWQRYPEDELVQHHRDLVDASTAGRIGELVGSLTVDDVALARGLADGTLAIDTRLRDALRALRAADGSFALPEPDSPQKLAFPHPGPRSDAELAAEVAPLHEIDGIVRAEQRVAAFETRLRRLEREPLGRAAVRLGHRLAPR
jgi:hypothetical protein